MAGCLEAYDWRHEPIGVLDPPRLTVASIELHGSFVPSSEDNHRNLGGTMRAQSHVALGVAASICFFAGAPAGAQSAAAPGAGKGVAVTANTASLLPALARYVAKALGELDQIPAERRERLNELATFVARQHKAGQPAKLTFICTHNSRRSHLSQVWAQTAAQVFGVAGVETYSGGTEVTAFNPRAVAALQRAGFLVERLGEGGNPLYHVRFRGDGAPIECFSKKFSEPPNPKADFAAVMTCSTADAACPLVPGAVARISIPYEDPKAFDGTEREEQAYDERCRQIAREMLYVFRAARSAIEAQR